MFRLREDWLAKTGGRWRIWWALLLTLAFVMAPEPARPVTDMTLSGTRQALAQQALEPEPTRPVAQETPTPTPEPVQTFAETNFSISGDFLRAWRAGGGLAILGLPITEERPEIGDDGRLITVQWFERARLERAPAGAGAPATVRFGLLGRQVLGSRPLTSVALEATERARSFPETGQRVADPFLGYWERNGGLAVFGYPITGLVREANGDDGRERLVQYFERARFEDHGPAANPRVHLGLVGREALAQPVRLWWEAEEALTHTFTTAFVYAGGGLGRDQALYVRDSAPAADGGRYRARYTVRVPRQDAYAFWGRLLTLDEASPLRWRVDDRAWQPIERLSPPTGLIALQPPHRYAWYRLGTLALTAGWHNLEFEVATDGESVAGLDAFTLTTVAGPPVAAGSTPAQVASPLLTLQATLDAPPVAWPRLHRGLAQGGEHRDPAYLARAADRLRSLNATYIRIDHIFDYYDVVQPPATRGGDFQYDFTKLDVALDAVLASGAQPFLSLGLTPRVFSPTGVENAPPADLRAWRELVTATVRHVNGQRGLGIRYWEVWNEPNLSPFWAGSFQEYARLYEVSAAAIAAADPTAKVGGPATSGHEYWVRSLIDYAAKTNSRLDFVSWHTYHVRPVMLANQVALVRRDLARHPRFRDTELMLTEWSLNSDFGANAGFVGDSHVVAAYAAAVIHTLADANVSQALFFEAIDGQPPDGQTVWGRWGALAYDGQPKPAYHALTALNRLHDGRLPASSPDPRIGLLATRQEGRLALLIWRLSPESQEAQTVRLALKGAPAGLTHLRRWTVDAGHSRLGGQLDEDTPVAGSLVDGVWTASVTLSSNSVTLLTWEP
jgi:beta-xylosidase